MTDHKGKVNELDHVKIKSLRSVRDTGNSVGRWMTYLEMIFANYELVARIYHGFFNQQEEEKKHEQRCEQRIRIGNFPEGHQDPILEDGIAFGAKAQDSRFQRYTFNLS